MEEKFDLGPSSNNAVATLLYRQSFKPTSRFAIEIWNNVDNPFSYYIICFEALTLKF